MANTPAVARHPWAAGDMVRLGIGLMGASLVASDAKQLQPVVQVTTTLSQLRKVPAGQGVSYGSTDSAPHERLIATLPIGYADGIPRALSNGDRVELLGRHILLEDFAKSCGTISYEVLTGLSPRLPRLAANGL
jgi:alanine racemase